MKGYGWKGKKGDSKTNTGLKGEWSQGLKGGGWSKGKSDKGQPAQENQQFIDWRCMHPTCGYMNQGWRLQCRLANEHLQSEPVKGPSKGQGSIGKAGKSKGWDMEKVRNKNLAAPIVIKKPESAVGEADWEMNVDEGREEPRGIGKRETMEELTSSMTELKKQIEVIEKIAGESEILISSLQGLRKELERVKSRITEAKPLSTRLQTAAMRMGNAKKSTSTTRAEVEEIKAYLETLSINLADKLKEEEIAVLEHQVLFEASERERKKVEELTSVVNRGKKEQATAEVEEWLRKGELDEDVVEYLAMKREQRLARLAGLNDPVEKKEGEKDLLQQPQAENVAQNTQPNVANPGGTDEGMQGNTPNSPDMAQVGEPGTTGFRTPEDGKGNHAGKIGSRARSRSPPK